MLKPIWARPSEALTQHTEAVVERIANLAQVKPLAQYPRLWHRVFWAAVLHDSGKLASGFQKSLRSKQARWGHRHEVISLGFMNWFDFDLQDQLWIAATIASHHQDLPTLKRRYDHPEGAAQLALVLEQELSPERLRAWYDWLSTTVPSWLEQYPLKSLVQYPGMLSFSQPSLETITTQLERVFMWSEVLFLQGLDHPDSLEATLLRGLLMQADHMAAAHAPQLHHLKLQVSLPTVPYPHQQHCAVAQGHFLLLAPTGSGKTEAALLWALAQGCTRLFYLLPYRASLNAMHQRLKAFTSETEIGIQHGRILQNLYQVRLEQGYQAQAAEQYAKQQLSLARLHTFSLNLFSPFHLLQAVYRFRGCEMEFAHYVDSCFVMDEIHAYDPKRLALIIGSLTLLTRYWGVSLFMMTATLPPMLHQILSSALPPLKIIQADPITYKAFQRHRLQVLEGELQNHLEELLSYSTQGQAVLVTVNTVRRARQIAAELIQKGAEVLLLHGRFNSRDRWQHEQQLWEKFGLGQRHSTSSPPIVVATQVIEVSLNLDFDCIYSDPAPLDALIQRFGRVNRGGRIHFAQVNVFQEPTGREQHFPIYEVSLVEATLSILQKNSGQPLDEALYSAWLAEIYADERADLWLQTYHEQAALFNHAVLEQLHPFEEADEGLWAAFRNLFDECQVLPLCLEEEYLTLQKTDPIAASLLLVSLSYRQYKMLERNKQAWREADFFYVDCLYDSVLGLQLENDGEE